MENIGLQLFSIRDLTEVDFFGTLEMVGKIGYDGVEFAGYFGTSARDLKNALNNFGLKPAGSHIGIEGLISNPDEIIEYSLELGDPYIIVPALPENMRDCEDSWKKIAENFNKIGEKCRKNGIALGYHNHNFEFEKFNGEYGLDILVANTQPENCFIELDTFWVEYSGLRSVDFIEKYKERCVLLHIKEMKSLDDRVSTVIGRGIMDFKSIITIGKKYGVQWYTVEQEEFQDPELQSIEEDLKYLKLICD